MRMSQFPRLLHFDLPGCQTKTQTAMLGFSTILLVLWNLQNLLFGQQATGQFFIKMHIFIWFLKMAFYINYFYKWDYLCVFEVILLVHNLSNVLLLNYCELSCTPLMFCCFTVSQASLGLVFFDYRINIHARTRSDIVCILADLSNFFTKPDMTYVFLIL